MKSTLIMKFGGASVAAPEQFSHIANIVLQQKEKYERVVVVVSAMGNTTDQLIQLAKTIHPDPPQREYDMLVTVGERISISLLAMALARKNCEAISFTGSQSGIITSETHTDARIVDVRPSRLLSHLDAGKIVIVAGFQGVSRRGEITTLGRGGSDTTAVALGVALCAEKVEFFKDVPGIFTDDPKLNPKASFFNQLSYQHALEIVSAGSRILHTRSIELARQNQLLLHVRPFNELEWERAEGTLIGDSLKNRNHINPGSLAPIYEQE